MIGKVYTSYLKPTLFSYHLRFSTLRVKLPLYFDPASANKPSDS